MEKTVAAPKSVKKEGISIDVFDTKGKVAETMQLPKDMFGVEINKALLAQAVRVHLINTRAGSASTKGRGEVRGSTRKIYRQKGTGRARHGGVRAPIFVHGGIAHGPHPIDFVRSLSKKMKKQALSSALSAALKEKNIIVVSGLLKVAPKTKAMAEVVNNLSLIKKNKLKNALLFVEPVEAEQLHRMTRNIAGVTTMPVTQLNAYDVLSHKRILFAKEAIESMGKAKAK